MPAEPIDKSPMTLGLGLLNLHPKMVANRSRLVDVEEGDGLLAGTSAVQVSPFVSTKDVKIELRTEKKPEGSESNHLGNELEEEKEPGPD